MKANAYAKVNLGLHVRPAGSDGIHPLRGLFQTVDWHDEITVEDAEEDSIEVPNGGAPEDESNLAWQAIVAARKLGRTDRPTRLVVLKQIPSPAGLGGGSADAAAALHLAARRFSVSYDDVRKLAVDLGSDVPFAFVGGTAIVTGNGEFVTPRSDATGFAARHRGPADRARHVRRVPRMGRPGWTRGARNWGRCAATCAARVRPPRKRPVPGSRRRGTRSRRLACGTGPPMGRARCHDRERFSPIRVLPDAHRSRRRSYLGPE